jgi:hypothetical protein
MNRICESRCDFETKNDEDPATEEDFSLMFLTSFHAHLGEQVFWE